VTDSPPGELQWVPLARATAAEHELLTRLVQQCESAAVGEVDTSAEEVAAMVADPEVDRSASVLCFDAEHTLLGLRLVTVVRAERDVAVDCWVTPHLPQHQQAEVMAHLTDDLVSSTRDLARAAEPDHPWSATVSAETDLAAADSSVWQVVAGAYRQDVIWAAALQSHGLTRVRTFERLRLAHGDAIPVPTPPAGVTVHSVAAESDLRTFHRLHLSAFADHWGGEPERPFDEWLAWQRSHAGVREDLWRIAVADGEPVGICSGSDVRADFGVAYIPLLGVVRSARGRGIAKYLLYDQFALSAARGFPATELTVDATSQTGADQLYRSVGMRSYRVMDIWSRSLR
jgi:GNAT superfamily N-acetyltransferase